MISLEFLTYLKSPNLHHKHQPKVSGSYIWAILKSKLILLVLYEFKNNFILLYASLKVFNNNFWTIVDASI